MTIAHKSLKKKINHAQTKMQANRVALQQQATAMQQMVSPKTIGVVATGAFLLWLAPKTIRGLRHKFFARKVSEGIEAVMETVPPVVAEKVSSSKKVRGILNYVVDGAAAISSLSSLLGMLQQKRK